jgi:hypothetical protein
MIHPFQIKITPISNGDGYWNYNKVEIFKNDIKVGEYTRHYSGMTEETFCPVKFNDKWYALFSADYELIEIMDLQTGNIIPLTEESKEQMDGFCPVEIFCPFVFKQEWENNKKEKTISYISYSQFKEDGEKEQEVFFSRIAFVSGCVWGDDSSWKMNFLDLSGIEKGEIFYVNQYREKEWYYEELATNKSLNKIYCYDSFEEGDNFDLNNFILEGIIIPKAEYVNFEKRKFPNYEQRKNILKTFIEMAEKEHPEFLEENTTGWDLLENAKLFLKDI